MDDNEPLAVKPLLVIALILAGVMALGHIILPKVTQQQHDPAVTTLISDCQSEQEAARFVCREQDKRDAQEELDLQKGGELNP